MCKIYITKRSKIVKKTLFYSFCQLYNKKNCQITLYTTFWCYVPFINIYSLQLYSLHIIFACLYSLLLVICFEANRSESDPFICFEANKYSLRSEYRGHPNSKFVTWVFQTIIYVLRGGPKFHHGVHYQYCTNCQLFTILLLDFAFWNRFFCTTSEPSQKKKSKISSKTRWLPICFWLWPASARNTTSALSSCQIIQPTCSSPWTFGVRGTLNCSQKKLIGRKYRTLPKSYLNHTVNKIWQPKSYSKYGKMPIK